MRVLSLNLNGIRSAAAKGFFAYAAASDADVICLQEVRAQAEHVLNPAFALAGYHAHFHLSSVKKAYSGVAVYARHAPDRVIEGFGMADVDQEGRYLQLDFGQLSVASVYLPSGSSGPERQAFKFALLDQLDPWLARKREEQRHFILCGDLNIAHRPIDLKNWRGNQKNSGFLPAERAWIERHLAHGWVDAQREVVGPDFETYTWWSNRGQAFAKNVGWRIDYQLASPSLRGAAHRAEVYTTSRFSDHAPLIIDYQPTFSELAGPQVQAIVWPENKQLLQ